MNSINLNDCRQKGSKVLSGRNEGKLWRKKFKLDNLDKCDCKVIVDIPEDLFSINISFFLGLFGNSVRKLGEKAFKEKYEFSCDEVIMEDIDTGIKNALKTSDVLKKE